MKIRIGWFLILFLIIGIGIYIYNFFNEGNRIYKHSNYEFTMNIDDFATVDDTINLKYRKSYEKSGEYFIELIIINESHINKLTLSNIKDEEISIKKTDYNIKLINFDTESKEITIKLIKETQ